MTKKEFIKHYNNIMNFPDIGIHPEKRYELANEIQRLADIDKIPYRIALHKICDAFFSQYLWIGVDDSNLKEIEKAICNLSFLRYLEDL